MPRVLSGGDEFDGPGHEQGEQEGYGASGHAGADDGVHDNAIPGTRLRMASS